MRAMPLHLIRSRLAPPVTEYTHDGGDCSISGGDGYRGSAYPNLYGMYLYADYCTGKIWGLIRNGDDWVSTLLADTAHIIPTFGLGEDGNVYMATMAIKWTGCNAAVLSCQIDSPPLVGEFPIERVALDNVPMCEALQKAGTGLAVNSSCRYVSYCVTNWAQRSCLYFF